MSSESLATKKELHLYDEVARRVIRETKGLPPDLRRERLYNELEKLNPEVAKARRRTDALNAVTKAHECFQNALHEENLAFDTNHNYTQAHSNAVKALESLIKKWGVVQEGHENTSRYNESREAQQIAKIIAEQDTYRTIFRFHELFFQRQANRVSTPWQIPMSSAEHLEFIQHDRWMDLNNRDERAGYGI